MDAVEHGGQVMKRFPATDFVISIDGMTFPATCIDFTEELDVEEIESRGFPPPSEPTTITMNFTVPASSVAHWFGTHCDNDQTERDLEGTWLWS